MQIQRIHILLVVIVFGATIASPRALPNISGPAVQEKSSANQSPNTAKEPKQTSTVVADPKYGQGGALQTVSGENYELLYQIWYDKNKKQREAYEPAHYDHATKIYYQQWEFYEPGNSAALVSIQYDPKARTFAIYESGKNTSKTADPAQVQDWIAQFEKRFAEDGTVTRPWDEPTTKVESPNKSPNTIDPDVPGPLSADVFNPPKSTSNEPKKEEPKREEAPKSDKTSTNATGGNTASTAPFNAPGVKTEITKEFDLTRIKYIGEFGGFTINLPANLRPGDTFTGSFYPAGNNATELTKNFNDLSNYSFNFVGDGELKPLKMGYWGPIEDLTRKTDVSHNASGDYLLSQSQPHHFLPGTKALEIYWRNELRTRIELMIVREKQSTPSSITTPTLAQQGRFITIPGPFDGTISPTDFTKIGGLPVPTIAESPYGRVVWNTSNNLGQSNIEISENGQTGTCPFHNVSVYLSANNLTLKRGQHADVTVTFTGLGRLNQDMPYDVVNHSPAVVHMTAGAESQSRMVPASKVANPNDAHGGTFSDKIGITGVAPGPFTITATVRWKETCDIIKAVQKNYLP